MKHIQVTNLEATKIGFLLSTVAAFLLFVIWPGSWHFTIFATNALIIVFLFGIAGALLGRLISKTRRGAWFGAAITILFLAFSLYVIASTVTLD